jgi:hypothetical protein
MRVPLAATVGGVDRDTPSADVLQPLNPTTSETEDQDVGISGV